MSDSVVEEIQLKEENLGEVSRFVIFFVNLFEVFIQTLILVVFIFSFLFRTVGVDGTSMNNTLQHKDRLFVVSSILHKPKEKDIVIVNTLDTLGAFIVKRVIAKEGQTIDIKLEGACCHVYIDGKKIKEGYIKDLIDKYHLGDLKYPITIPKGHVFVMGDNRNDSRDSREIGPVNLEKIKGTVVSRILPVRNFVIFKN